MTDYISLVNVHRSYGEGSNAVHALRGVDMLVASTEVVAITGPSGSGKTTLLNCLLGLDLPDSGSIRVGDTAVTNLSYEQAVDWRRDQVAVVFQNAGLLPYLSARENVDMALRIRGIDQTERTARIADAFDRLQISDFSTHRPAELSGGQQQRVSLARAFATRPSLLVADEPTGELDTDTTLIVLNALRASAADYGITMLLATHDDEVQAIADRTIRIADGRIQP